MSWKARYSRRTSISRLFTKYPLALNDLDAIRINKLLNGKQSILLLSIPDTFDLLSTGIPVVIWLEDGTVSGLRRDMWIALCSWVLFGIPI